MASNTKQTSDLNIFAFWKAQQKTWKVTVIRTSLERLGYKLVLPYLSLYIILMGATKAQIGYVTSIGLLMAAFLSPILGQYIDRHGPKKMYMFGICVLISCYIAFANAHIWQIGALGMLLHQLGQSLGGTACANICGNCLANCDRAKGMLVCETLAAGVLGMAGPAFAGWYMLNVLGVETPTAPEHIRPLFWFTLGLTVISLFVVIFGLDNRGWGSGSKAKRNPFADAVKMIKADKNCAKWVIMSGIARLPMAMVIPYFQLYAAEKGADTATLAIMTTATALTSVVSGYFFGILSDRIGRKKTMFITTSLYITGLVMLIMGNTPGMFIVAGMLAGFQEIGQVINGSMQHELVPGWARGRWSGVNGMVGSLMSASVAAIAGNVYDVLGGHMVFLIYIVCEVLIRLPLLFSMPETLTYKVDESKFEALKG